MDKPKVSVIMGVYNCEKTISVAIESIIAQTYTNWELIICDDCSTDKSVEIIQKYKDLDKRIVLIRNAINSKLAKSLNNCLAIAKGEYIARMDADDISLPKRLEEQITFLDSHQEFQVISCKSVVLDENGEREIIGKEGEPHKECMLFGVPFVHPTIMMRKSAYDAVGGYTVLPRTQRGQDLDLWFKFFSLGYRGYILPKVLYKYYNFKSTKKNRMGLKLAMNYTKTNLVGFKLLKFPFYYYVMAFKPMISVLLPDRIKVMHRKNS